MRLFIAENPALLELLLMYYQNRINVVMVFIVCGDNQYVTWCVGHLLEQAEPDAYDPRYARWSLDDLPIIPK